MLAADVAGDKRDGTGKKLLGNGHAGDPESRLAGQPQRIAQPAGPRLPHGEAPRGNLNRDPRVDTRQRRAATLGVVPDRAPGRLLDAIGR